MKAFTVVELLISILIFLFIIAGIFTVWYVGNTTWQRDMALLDLQQQARQAMQGMVREIRQIDPDLPITLGESDISFTLTDDITDPLAPATYNIRYYLNDNNQVIREHPVSTEKVLANQINSLCFCWDSSTSSCLTNCSNLFPIRLEAVKNVGPGTLSFSLIEKVRLRNE